MFPCNWLGGWVPLLCKVEKHLHLEVKRRAESDKKLQEMFEARIAGHVLTCAAHRAVA